MPASVSFTSDRTLALKHVVALLESHGATVYGEPDLRTGDPYAWISQYILIRMTDPSGQPRHLTGMQAFPSSEHEDGWTRLTLGADQASYELFLSLALSEGGYLYDERLVGTAARIEREVELEYAPAFG